MPPTSHLHTLLPLGMTLLLTAACTLPPTSGGSSSGGSSAGEMECLDAISNELEMEIGADADSEQDEAAENVIVDFDDRLRLLPVRNADGTCTVNTANWIQDCMHDAFSAMREQSLACRGIPAGIEIIRPPNADYPQENIIVTVGVRHAPWSGPQRATERIGKDILSRIPFFKIVEEENEDGTTTTRCILDDRHMEIRGRYAFGKVVEFVAQTLIVPQPCTP